MPHGFHDAHRVVARFLQLPFTAFQGVDVGQRDDRAFDFVVERLVRPQGQLVPMPFVVLDFLLQHFQRIEHLLNQRPHLRDRCAQNDQIGAGDRAWQIAGGLVNGTEILAFAYTGRATNETHDGVGQSALAQGQSQGSTQQAYANQRDPFPTHQPSFGFRETRFNLKTSGVECQEVEMGAAFSNSVFSASVFRSVGQRL